MDPKTGKLYSQAELQQEAAAVKKRVVPVSHPTPSQMKRRKVGRNEPCPCGSGKKFKNCHYKPL